MSRVHEVAGRLARGLWTAWRATAVAALTLSVFRVAFLLRHRPPGAAYPARGIASALLMGARFDLKIAAVAFLPLVLLVALAPVRGRLRAVAAAWAALAFFALNLLAIVNDGYYAFYHSPIDSYVFGLFEDDFGAVWRSIWREHPVVLGAAFAAALAAVQTAVALRARGRAEEDELAPSPLARRAAVTLALVLALFMSIRGRLGTFPLNEQDMAVSPEPFLNAVASNGVFSLYVATKHRSRFALGKDPLKGIHRLGFATPGEAAAALGLAPAGATDDAVASALETVTPENRIAAARPPHVILAIMESWGADLLAYHSTTNDLLGRLAPHLAKGTVFRRFLSVNNGTDPTLESLLVGTPITPLIDSQFGAVTYPQAAALPFRAAGYRTVFATGGSGGWRGFSRALPVQGFDEVRDMSDVLATVPGARVGPWGVFDHELFAWAAARLREADRKGERLLLVLLTTTNHPPHAVPPEYRIGPLDPTVFVGRALGDAALRRPILETYQYACDALGGFMDAVREAGLAERTIVAATGDHNTRSFFEYPDANDLARRDGVPLFLAVPAPYLAGRRPDPDRWGSHRDLFPTLYGLALSRARVFRTGQDLLAAPARPPRALVQYNRVFCDAGVFDHLEPETGPESFWRWQGGALAPCADPACRAPLAALAREERAYVALFDWMVRRSALTPAAPPLRAVDAGAAPKGGIGLH